MSARTTGASQWRSVLGNAVLLAALAGLAAWLLRLQGGLPALQPPGLARSIAAIVAGAVWLAWCGGAWFLRTRARRLAVSVANSDAARRDGRERVLVAHA